MTPLHRGGMSNTTLMSRRMFLVAAGAAALAACGSSTSATNDTASSTTTPSAADTTVGEASTASDGFNTLWIPPVLEGTTFDLVLASSTATLLDGKSAATIAYNGASMWGPTLRMKQGDTVTVNVTNGLDEATTAHWHGVHLPPDMDGGPHQVIAPGDTWSPTWTVKNNAATYWYHPHAHELTWPQLSMGAGGFIIVQDDDESALALPRTYGVDDIPLVLTSRTFDGDSQIIADTIYGDHLLANGTMNAELEVPAQMVRFRILNAEIERAYTLGFADDRTFWVIGTDGGLVDAPVPVTRLVMVPGERYEFVVDLAADAAGSAVTMQSFNGGYSLGYPGGEPNESGEFGSLLNNATFDVLRLAVVEATADAVNVLPTSLVANSLWSASDATNERTLEITDTGPGTPFSFNDHIYSHDVIDQVVVLDTVETWNIQNGRIFGHSFHIHDVQFAIVERSSGPVPDYEKAGRTPSTSSSARRSRSSPSSTTTPAASTRSCTTATWRTTRTRASWASSSWSNRRSPLAGGGGRRPRRRLHGSTASDGQPLEQPPTFVVRDAQPELVPEYGGEVIGIGDRRVHLALGARDAVVPIAQ